jgi:2-C-methyl-D-erythritol 4-phosphate cytidylyltransferase
LGFLVETGKTNQQKIHVPVLYGNNGKVAKAFDADALHPGARFVIEVEAGRAVVNNQYLKDLFQACMMDGVDHLAIVVRNTYKSATMKSHDFETVVKSFETIYASTRLRLPLSGILVIGY